jgi:tetratricopeptide (TPR) repeat protein
MNHRRDGGVRPIALEPASRGPATSRPVFMARGAAIVAALEMLLVASVAVAQPEKASAVAGRDVTTASSDATRSAKQAEYGIALAMAGDTKGAESVFVAMLSAAPGDPRALNNLGNLRVVNGDLDVALAFYDRALKPDTEQAGVVLNRATALMLMGDVDAAEAEAARGVKLAGGEEAAAKLLGLPAQKGAADTMRGSDKPFVSKQEIRALLNAATMRVPGDSMKAGSKADSTQADPKARKAAKTWRSAGPRAGDTGDIASVLYWMK